jgi:CPA1 family monovalent cation:H+ antiporter
MVIGNYGRAKVPPHAEEFVEKFWTQFAFFANSLVFILIGLIFVSLSIRITDFFLPVIVAIILVAVGRALSVYPVVWLNNTFRIEEHIPNSWQHLLAWGSLRGALAVTMVLLIPDDLTVAGWNYLYSPKEFILALTLGCIFMTLFIKATTIEHLMRYLHISDFTDTEKLAFEEARGIVHLKALARLDRFKERGYISESIANVLKKEHMARLAASTAACTDRLLGDKSTLGTRVLHMYAIGVEKEMLKTLYTFGEVVHVHVLCRVVCMCRKK